MKKLLLLLGALMASAPCYALDNMYGDLFAFENKASSFTVDVDAKNLNRFSVQVNYSTNTAPAPAAFTAANISLSDDTIEKTAHGFGRGLAVLLATAATPSGLVTGTTYYVVKVNDNLFKLSDTSTGAVAVPAVVRDITAVVSSTDTWTLTPIALNLAGSGFTWLGSNDGTNFDTIGISSQSLVATGIGGGTRIISFGEYAFRFFRFNFIGPLRGQILMRALIFGQTQ